MLAACVSDAFERLCCSAAVVATAAVSELTEATPPGDPCSENIVVTIRRSIICRGCRDCPVCLGIGKPAAGVIFRLNGKHRAVADEKWSLRFYLRINLKLRSAKFLNLKLMGINDLRRIRKIHPCVAKICVVGQRETEVERAELIGHYRPFCDLVVAWVFGGPCICHKLAAKSLYVAELSAGQFSDIALDGDIFLRLVDTAVVKYEPLERVAFGLFVPTTRILPVVISIFG